MAMRTRSAPEKQELYCRYCKQDFVVYRSDLVVQCPRCGRTTQMPLQRRRLRLLAVAIIIAVALAVGLYLLFG